MNKFLYVIFLFCLQVSLVTARADEKFPWWNADWPLRATVSRPAPWRDTQPRVVEVAVDFSALLQQAGIADELAPSSLRLVERLPNATPQALAFAYRTEFNPVAGREEKYLAWIAKPRPGQLAEYDIYFDTRDQAGPPGGSAAFAEILPPENLVGNPGFEELAGELPAGWIIAPDGLARLGQSPSISGKQSLCIDSSSDTGAVYRTATISQRIDIRRYAGQEIVFECDLLAEYAPYGAPVAIELEQFREDGERIPEYAVDSRWLTIELAQGQLVNFRERGRFHPQAVDLNLVLRVCVRALDVDNRAPVPDADGRIVVWVDRVLVRPGERWPWPANSGAGFVDGAVENAPLNKAFEFTGLRRLMFAGASEGTLNGNVLDPGPQSVHWGLQTGTLEFWCKPDWNDDDGERVFFEGVSYLHRLQSLLRKFSAKGANYLEFTIADASRVSHTVSAAASFQSNRWHHIAACWDFPRAHLQLYMDGLPLAVKGPGQSAWPSSLHADDKSKTGGIGIHGDDRRSMPMQAYIGGDRRCRPARSAEAAIDEFRVSDTVRYKEAFVPPREEFALDKHTRALFHFENEQYGVHYDDDGFVRGHLCNELHPRSDTAPLEILTTGKVTRLMPIILPHAAVEQFEEHRSEKRLTVTRPLRALPDAKFIEYRERAAERVITEDGEDFRITVGGDYEPLTRAITYHHADPEARAAVTLPAWRVNNEPISLDHESLRTTLGAGISDDAERAFDVFQYITKVTRYYNPGALARYVNAYSLFHALNVQPFDQCGPLNTRLFKAFINCGISANCLHGTHHQFQHAFYQGSWRLFDNSPRMYWLKRDNATVASRRDIEEDVYLLVRQGKDSVLPWLPGRAYSGVFGKAFRVLPMDFTLRPGERTALCWHNEGRWFQRKRTADEEAMPPQLIPPIYGNGVIIYQPTSRGAAAVMENLLLEESGDSVILRADNSAEAAALIYRARTAHLFSGISVSGRYTARQAGAISLSLSRDEGNTWNEVWRNPQASGEIGADIVSSITGCDAFWLKIHLAPDADAAIQGLLLRGVFVSSPLAMSGVLRRGENHVRFHGGSIAAPILTQCRWTERYRSDLGISLNGLSFYTLEDDFYRNLYVVAPGREITITATLRGRPLDGMLTLEGLPDGWVCEPRSRMIALKDTDDRVEAAFQVQTSADAHYGDIHALQLTLQEGDTRRETGAQVLIAEAALLSEAENASARAGDVTQIEDPEFSGGYAIEFNDIAGRLDFDFHAPQSGGYVLWFRARRLGGSLNLTLDGATQRLRVTRAPGAGCSNPGTACTRKFGHFDTFDQWAWYRVPELELDAGDHRLSLHAFRRAGMAIDALLLLRDEDASDRGADNLLQIRNFAPWYTPESFERMPKESAETPE